MEPATRYLVAPTGVVFVRNADTSARQVLQITATPRACAGAINVVRQTPMGDGATALWVESTPPCEATQEPGACGEGSNAEKFLIEARTESDGR